MASGIRWAACIIGCAALAGCASNDLMVKRQTETESRVELLTQTGKKHDQRLTELSSVAQEHNDRSKETAAQIKQLQATIGELRVALEDLKARLTLVAQQAATPKVEVVNQDSFSRKVKESGPPSDYLKAFGLYSANNFPAAIKAFEAFITSNPNSDYAPNALYWIGECYYSQSELAKAQETFQKMIDAYPKSAKLPDAMLKLGYTLAARSEKAKATALFEAIVKNHPGSPAAAKARERLTAN